MSARIIAAVVAVAVIGIANVLWSQHRQISVQRDVITAQNQAVEQLQAGVQAMQDIGAQARDQVTQLLQAQQHVQTSLATRQAEIRRLQTDVQEIRDWADQPLPIDIRRVLEQPATVGANNYGAAMPTSDPLRDVRVTPQDKR